MEMLAESVCKKINAKPKVMLPSIAHPAGQVDGINEKIRVLSMRVDVLTQGGEIGQRQEVDLKGMKFQLNRIEADVNLMKKELEVHNMENIEEEVKKIKILDFDVETLKLNIDNMA